MIAAAARFVLAVLACMLVIAWSAPLGEILTLLITAVQRTPAEAISLLAALIAFTETIRLALRLTRTRAFASGVPTGLARPIPAGAAAMAALRRDPTSSYDLGLERRARHEAAHVAVALAVGREDVSTDLFIRGASGGQTRYSCGDAPLADATFEDMIIGYAGHLVDVDAGHFDRGSLGDMRSLIEQAVLILSTGQRPALHNGELTIDGLVRCARQAAQRILAQHQEDVDRIAAALAEQHALDDTQLRELIRHDKASEHAEVLR